MATGLKVVGITSCCANHANIYARTESKLTTLCTCLGAEANMLRVQEPVIIIGDIHGQFFDMIHMFEKVVDPKGIPK